MELFSTLSLQRDAHRSAILHVSLNRPSKRNAMNDLMFTEIGQVFRGAAADGALRVIVLHIDGCGGLDLIEASSAFDGDDASDAARNALAIRSVGRRWQNALTALEKCGKVVIASISGPCWGAGLELICAADIRWSTRSSYFVAAEIDVGLAADVGGLQRFPRIVGNESLVRELVFSGRRLSAVDAERAGLLSGLFESREALDAAALALAQRIAAKSPVALLGAKVLLNYARDHSVDDALEYAITWNAAMLQGVDMKQAAMAMLMKQEAEFDELWGSEEGEQLDPLGVTGGAPAAKL
jgi:enoyl-CoA hydratase/carnithine racemase|tara:strand:- start:84 stop:974 length:891 start_codon:yes stop_codon:yes gene_type:complete